MAYIAPRLRQLPVSVEDLLAVEVYVDSNGRVQDCRALSNARGLKNLPPEIKNLLIFTAFRPATFMSRQTTGTATLLFAHTGVAAIPSSD